MRGITQEHMTKNKWGWITVCKDKMRKSKTWNELQLARKIKDSKKKFMIASETLLSYLLNIKERIENLCAQHIVEGEQIIWHR